MKGGVTVKDGGRHVGTIANQLLYHYHMTFVDGDMQSCETRLFTSVDVTRWLKKKTVTEGDEQVSKLT